MFSNFLAFCLLAVSFMYVFFCGSFFFLSFSSLSFVVMTVIIGAIVGGNGASATLLHNAWQFAVTIEFSRSISAGL